MLFVDNATSHQCDVPTPFIKVVYLPPNTTSLIQPCDQGTIRALKAHYRRQVTPKILLAIEKGEDAQQVGKTISGLDAMFMLKRAMFLVSPLTVQNWFRKGKFGALASEVDIAEEVHIEEEMYLANEEFLRFVTFDDTLPTSGDLTDAEICQTVISADDENQDEEESEGGNFVTKIKWGEGIEAMHNFRCFLEENYKDFDEMPLAKIEEIVEQDASKMWKQASIFDYFPVVDSVQGLVFFMLYSFLCFILFVFLLQ